MKKERTKSLRRTFLSDYGISEERYRELLYFCRQYGEKKQKVQSGILSPSWEGMPKLVSVDYRADVNLIEQTAKEAGGILSPYILRSVTEGIPYEQLGSVPVCKSDFHGYRRRFFALLSLRR